MADSKTYTGMTRGTLERLRASLERAHVPLPSGDTGEISSNGLSGTFAFDEGAGTLRLDIAKYPMFMPKGMIWKAIDGAIADAKR